MRLHVKGDRRVEEVKEEKHLKSMEVERGVNGRGGSGIDRENGGKEESREG